MNNPLQNSTQFLLPKHVFPIRYTTSLLRKRKADTKFGCITRISYNE